MSQNKLKKKNHSNKTIVDTYTHFDPRLEIFALFLDKKMKTLNNTKHDIKQKNNLTLDGLLEIYKKNMAA